jgi:hypothetical protein
MQGGENAGYALPKATLELLAEVVRMLEISNVFEFGSGCSTKLFLELGCHVASLEDSETWLQKTLQTVDAPEQTRLSAICRPLERIFDKGAPFLSWKPDSEILAHLAEAQLVLIDSPAFPPSREHALLMTLRHAPNAIAIFDDANIPTVRRFCARIAHRRCAVAHFTPLDHGLYFFSLAKNGGRDFLFSRSPLEFLKTWRRYFLAKQSSR